MNKLNIRTIEFSGLIKLIGNSNSDFIINVKPINQADENSLVWLKPNAKNPLQLLQNTNAKFIICNSECENFTKLLDNKTLIIVENPRLAFLRVIEKYFSKKLTNSIHPSAIIHPKAKIHPNCCIGPNTYIGECFIDEGTVLYGNNYIYDGVIIGKNVIIHAGTVIGSDGFGYERNEKNEFEKFPHIGGVLIENNVEIGSNSSIDRGVIGNTIIGEGAKIDNLVHIAHNVEIGKHTVVIAHAMIAGSVTIGDYSWIAPSVSIMNGIKIGNNVTIGMSALVTKNINDNETWLGVPAKPLDEYIMIHEKIKRLK
jgi:UDP-3-O-[3-hydroxymyristoyl] glucosamine N-acyltransferase